MVKHQDGEHTFYRCFIGGACGDGTHCEVAIGHVDREEEFGTGHVVLSMAPAEDYDGLEEAIADGWRPIAGLHPSGALMLADRLTRAARIVMEEWEDGPDMEREFKRVQTEE